jgi:hypothetical protein
MTTTRTIPSPDHQYSLTVVYETIDIDEDIYKASVAVRIVEVETDYNENGEVILPEWVTVDYINNLR